MFELEDVKLEFRYEALEFIAQKAMERKTGARGLRSILEQVLLDIMYELPDKENIQKIVIDESTAKRESDPIIIYNPDERKQLVSDN